MGNVKVCPKKVQKYIGQKLFGFNAGKHLAWAWNSGNNMIMFGPGGYGKSDAAELFHEFLVAEGALKAEDEYYVMSFGQGMTEERLLGGIDMPTFQSEGDIIYLLKNAFVSYEYVIFEEMWDAFPAVLLILKDILQSGYVRMGTQRMKVKTKFVVGCTNRSRKEVVEDDSTEALMQRFCYEKEVNWSSWGTQDYSNAFKAALGLDAYNAAQADCNIVAELCERVSKAMVKAGGKPVSPRTAGKALGSVIANEDLECLTGFHGFEKETKKMMRDYEARKLDLAQEQELIDALCSIKKALKKAIKDTNSGIKRAEACKIAWDQRMIFATLIRDKNISHARRSLDYLIDTVNEYFRGHVKKALGKPPEGSFAAKLLAGGTFTSIAHLIEVKEPQS